MYLEEYISIQGYVSFLHLKSTPLIRLTRFSVIWLNRFSMLLISSLPSRTPKIKIFSHFTMSRMSCWFFSFFFIFYSDLVILKDPYPNSEFFSAWLNLLLKFSITFFILLNFSVSWFQFSYYNYLFVEFLICILNYFSNFFILFIYGFLHPTELL